MWSRAAGIEARPALLQGFLGGAGFTAETLAEVLVIETLGPAWLPVGLAGAAVLSLALTAGLARQLAGPRRLPRLAGVAIAVGGIIWGGLHLAPTPATLAFLLVSRPLRDAMAVASGNLIAARYDPQMAKRALPRLAASGQIGAIVAGLTLPFLLRVGGASAAVAAWPALAGAALVVAWGLPMAIAGGDSARSVAQSALPVERPAAILRRSPLLRTLAIASMLAVATGAALGLVAAMILSTSIPDPARLASLYSLIGALCSVAILAVQAFGLPSLLGRFGTARVALLPPVLAMGISSIAIVGGGLAAGVAAQVGRLTLRPAFQTPIEEILLGLLPVGERGVGRAWLRGGAVPMAGLISSVSLAALAALDAKTEMVAGLALIAATGGLAAALVLRRAHRQASLALARSNDVLAQRLALPAFGGVDAAVRDEIARRLATCDRDDERLLLVALLADLDPIAATAAVATLLPAASPAASVALLSSLAERRCPAAPLLPQIPQLLASSEPTVRRATLAALATTSSVEIAVIEPLLDDPDPAVALMAVEYLVGRGDAAGERARVRLRRLAVTAPGTVRAAAAPLIARIAPEALAALLADPSVSVRRAAARAAVEVVPMAAAVSTALIAAASDGASSVRVAAVEALSRLGSSATPALIVALDDPVPLVRAAAAAALVKGGAEHAANLAAHLPSGHGWGRAAGLAILTYRNPWRWRATLLAEEGIGLASVTHLALARTALGSPHGPFGALLRRDVDDAIAEGLLRWGECLTITDGVGTTRVIQQGLASGTPLVSAQAQEALEAVRSPVVARQVARLLAPTDASVPADRPRHEVTPSRAMLDGLAIGAGCWRWTLMAAAAREEPGLLIDHTTTDALDGKDRTMLSLVERATLLRGVPPFADLSSEHLRLLAGVAEEVEVAAGETVVVAGSSGDHLYVVVAGQIALEEQRGISGSVARIGTLGPGAALGEEAVFDGGTHVLNATATTECRLLALEREVLMALLDEQPALARALIAWLSARLRETTGKLAERTRSRPRPVIDLLDKLGDGH